MERLNVWNGLDELAFYENTMILELIERSQGISPVSISERVTELAIYRPGISL
jgi:hypothetical protein